MMLSLNVEQRTQLLHALGMLDAYEAIVPAAGDVPARTIRVPFKLGAERRIVVKNMAALSSSLRLHNEARMALVREIWPDKAADRMIARADDPENYDRFAAELRKMAKASEEIELAPLSFASLYDGGQDFPTAALLALDGHGLIEGDPAAAKPA